MLPPPPGIYLFPLPAPLRIPWAVGAVAAAAGGVVGAEARRKVLLCDDGSVGCGCGGECEGEAAAVLSSVCRAKLRCEIGRGKG